MKKQNILILITSLIALSSCELSIADCDEVELTNKYIKSIGYQLWDDDIDMIRYFDGIQSVPTSIRDGINQNITPDYYRVFVVDFEINDNSNFSGLQFSIYTNALNDDCSNEGFSSLIQLVDINVQDKSFEVLKSQNDVYIDCNNTVISFTDIPYHEGDNLLGIMITPNAYFDELESEEFRASLKYAIDEIYFSFGLEDDFYTTIWGEENA